MVVFAIWGVRGVLEPPWGPDRMSDEARFELGLYETDGDCVHFFEKT